MDRKKSKSSRGSARAQTAVSSSPNKGKTTTTTAVGGRRTKYAMAPPEQQHVPVPVPAPVPVQHASSSSSRTLLDLLDTPKSWSKYAQRAPEGVDDVHSTLKSMGTSGHAGSSKTTTTNTGNPFISRMDLSSSKTPYQPPKGLWSQKKTLETASGGDGSHSSLQPPPETSGYGVLRGTLSPADQIAQRVVQLLSPELGLMREQQEVVRQDLAKSDETIRGLVGEVGRLLGQKEKEKEGEKREREDRERAARWEREKKSFDAMVMLAKRMEEVKSDVAGIARLVGVGKGMMRGYGEGSSMVERLESVDMNVEEWLEKHRDQEATMESQGRDLTQMVPLVVRHEIGISPIRRIHTDHAVSTGTTSTAKPARKDYVSVQVGSSPTEPPAEASLLDQTMTSPETDVTRVNSSPDYAIPNNKEGSVSAIVGGSTLHGFKTCSHSCHKDKWRNIHIYTRGDNGGKDIHLKTHTCGEEACGSIWSTRDDEFVKFGNRLASRCESQKTHEHLVMLYQSAWRKLHPNGGEPPMNPSGNPVDFLRDPRFICEKSLPWLAEVVHEAGGPAFVDLGAIDLDDPLTSAQNYDDDPFLSRPMSSSKVTGFSGSRPPFPTMHERTPVSSKECSIKRGSDRPSTAKKTPLSMSVTGLFSPVDWSKFSVSTRGGAREISAAAIPTAATASPNKSYTLPIPPEGTVAALRKETLGDPYKYPLDSVALSSGFSAPSEVISPVVAGGEAAERMLSPESQFEDDRDGLVAEEMDKAPPSVNVSADPEPTFEAPSEMSRAASTESSLTSVMSSSEGASLTKVMTRSSMGSELTGLSSMRTSPSLIGEAVAPTEIEMTTITHDIRTASPPPPGASQTSGFTEDENTVMGLVMDDASSDTPPNSQMMITHDATSFELLSPTPTKKALIRNSSCSEMAVQHSQEKMERLREWMRVKRTKTSDTQLIGEGQNEDVVPPSPLFSSPSHSHHDDPTTYNDEAIDFPSSPTVKAAEQKLVPAEGDHRVEFVDTTRDQPTLVSPIKTDANDRGKTARKLLERVPSVISISSDSENEGEETVATSAKAIKTESFINADLSNGPPAAIKPVSSTPVIAVSNLLTKSLSPLSELSTEGVNIPRKRSLDLRHLIASLKDDDDVEIVSAKASKSSVAASVSSSLARPLEKSERALDTTPKASRAAQRKSLLVLPKKGQSAALTRVKRRKGPDAQARDDIESQDEDEQPPLKRVKLRKMAVDKGAKVSTGDVEVSPTIGKVAKVASPVKTPTKRSRVSQPRAATVAWPKIDKPNFDSFIECDSCERWYHVGCVGIQPGDIRLSATEIYQCPPCEAGFLKDGKSLSPVKNAQSDSENSACARSKCLRPKITPIVKSPEMYVVEGFVGAMRKIVGGRRTQLLYLVKWHGYSFGEATWEREEDMGLPNPGFFIEKFETQAKKEKVELSQCNHQAVLLKCAVGAGWNTQGVFVQKEI